MKTEKFHEKTIISITKSQDEFGNGVSMPGL